MEPLKHGMEQFGWYKVKKAFALLLPLFLMVSCSACGGSPAQGPTASHQQEQPEEGSEIAPNKDTPKTTPSQNEPTVPEKIVLKGQNITWDKFPFPTPETYLLTEDDATLYRAAVEIYNPKTYGATFSQSPEEVTDLSLPAFDVYEKVTDDTGDTTYYGLLHECDYYDLGSGLTDLANLTCSIHDIKLPASITLDTDGNLKDFTETREGTPDPNADTRRVCGPFTDLADYFNGITTSYPKTPHRIPDLDAKEMVQQYLEYFFTETAN